MFNKKFQFPTGLFMTASIAALILLPLFFMMFVSFLSEDNAEENNADGIFNASADPFITKVPDLKDLLKAPITNGPESSLGLDEAPIKIIYFSDFQCSFCHEQEKIISQLISEYGGKIKLIWKDLPVNDPASPSFQAAVAGRCAEEQDSFWPYHDLLYEENLDFPPEADQPSTENRETFFEIARKLNLSKSRFELCLDGETASRLVINNIEEADALNIYGVPFMYVNDSEVLGQISFDELKKMVENELTSN